MTDMVEEALELGRKNKEMMELGKAWCTHIRAHRVGGVGLVEQMSGLPVTGGGFTCDYATKPANPYLMQLSESAVSFYENNCRQCTDRSRGGRIPNLGTWAEQQIAERDEREQEEAERERVAAEERQQRVNNRTFVAGSLSAAAQQVVGLVNRVDLHRWDEEAANELRAAAELAPEVFSDEIKQMLYVDADQLRIPVLLEVLLRVDASTGSALLHSLCVSAVRDGWAQSEGCRYLSENGTKEDLDDGLVDGVIFHAAWAGLPAMFRRGGEPAALLHYHSLSPDAVESRFKALLARGESWRRAGAAAAAQHVVSVDADAGTRLLSALLDGLRFPEDLINADEPSHKIIDVVALVLRNDPSDVEAAVAPRWHRASPEYRVRLLRCFEAALRRGSEPPSSEVATVVFDRALMVLSEQRVWLDYNLQEDYQRKAAELLRPAILASPTTVGSTNRILFLLLSWLEHARTFEESDPDGPRGAIGKMVEQDCISQIVRNVVDAVVAAGHLDPGGLLTTCQEIYRHAETTPDVRAKLVQVAARVAAEPLRYTGEILPLIYTAIFAAEQIVRAAGLEAAEIVMKALPSESLPPLLAEAVVAGLSDPYLIVVKGAIDASRRIPPDLVDQQSVADKLLVVALAHAKERSHELVVQHAIDAALRLAHDDARLLRGTRLVALVAVASMPPSSARDTLLRNRSLLQAKGWSDVAIRALTADDEHFEYAGDHRKMEILQELGRRDLTEVQIESLEQTELAAVGSDRQRLFLSADVFAEQSRPDVACRLIRSLLDTIPDTIEMSARRRAVRLTLLRFELEQAVALGDIEHLAGICEKAEELRADHAASDSEPDSLGAIRARTALLDTLGAIEQGSRNVEPLSAALAVFRDTSTRTENDVVWAFSELVEALIHGVRWTNALWNAEPETHRHAVAAKVRAEAVAEQCQEHWPPSLAEACKLLATLTNHRMPRLVASKLSQVPLPPRITTSFRSSPRVSQTPFESDEQRTEPSAALLIRLDGEPVMRPTVLRPGAMHQLQVEARVSEWPTNADRLDVTFLTVHPPDYLHASDITFTPDALEQPLEIRVAGERPLNTPPLSLTARAMFRHGSEQLDTRLAGNTTLELVTFEPDSATPLDMPHTARRLQSMMNELQNRLPQLEVKDRRDIRLLLEGVLRYGHNALDERLGGKHEPDEEWFQSELRFFLSSDQAIGARLAKGTGRAGGTTDLLLGNIVLELKVEKYNPISLERAQQRFTSQPTQYASAGDAPISLLAVLDVSPKRAPAGIMGNDIGWAYPETTAGSNPPIPSMVGIAIIRTGFPRPSDFSR
ncbi:MAG: hypothetical protein OXM57_05910 [bacterium]|nr:hypothetical protein [bacterium]MDE0352206.1 hypothetical protein [bacterium]